MPIYFYKGLGKSRKTTETLLNATSTTCKTLTVPAEDFTSNGRWSAVLSYTSQYSKAESPVRSFAYE